MKITRSALYKLIVQEVAKFGKPVDVADVEAEETEACDLADSLDNHVDHTVKETLKKKIALSESLQEEETKLIHRLRNIREARKNLTREHSS